MSSHDVLAFSSSATLERDDPGHVSQDHPGRSAGDRSVPRDPLFSGSRSVAIANRTMNAQNPLTVPVPMREAQLSSG
jgi:hypothetical protein